MSTTLSSLATDPVAIAKLTDEVLAGAEITASQARELLDVEPGSAAQAALFAGARRIREFDSWRFHNALAVPPT